MTLSQPESLFFLFCVFFIFFSRLLSLLLPGERAVYLALPRVRLLRDELLEYLLHEVSLGGGGGGDGVGRALALAREERGGRRGGEVRVGGRRLGARKVDGGGPGIRRKQGLFKREKMVNLFGGKLFQKLRKPSKLHLRVFFRRQISHPVREKWNVIFCVRKEKEFLRKESVCGAFSIFFVRKIPYLSATAGFGGGADFRGTSVALLTSFSGLGLLSLMVS